LAVQRFGGGRRWVAVTLMTFILFLLLIVPLSVAIGTIISHLDDFTGWIKGLQDFKLPPPPAWLPEIPFVGTRLTDLWQQVSTEGVEVLRDQVAPYAKGLLAWFVAEMGSFGKLFVQFVLTVVAAAILYAGGDDAADWILRFGARLGGERGEAAIRLAGHGNCSGGAGARL